MPGRAAPAVAARRDRERDLVDATRALFDERGMMDAPIEEIARAAGIARGLVYRHFSSKEELHVLTVTSYLAELHPLLEQAAADGTAEERVERTLVAYAAYCGRFPAFLDCSMALMRRPARELHDLIGDSVWLRLGQGMARCLAVVSGVLGDLGVEDPDLAANVAWTQTLGAMHLARLGVSVSQAAPGVPTLRPVDPEEVVRLSVASVLGGLLDRRHRG